MAFHNSLSNNAIGVWLFDPNRYDVYVTTCSAVWSDQPPGPTVQYTRPYSDNIQYIGNYGLYSTVKWCLYLVFLAILFLYIFALDLLMQQYYISTVTLLHCRYTKYVEFNQLHTSPLPLYFQACIRAFNNCRCL